MMAFKALSTTRKALVVVAVLMMLAASLSLTAAASATLLGPTGLIVVPTGDVLRSGEYNLGFTRYSYTNFLTFNTSLLENLEFGVTYISDDWGASTIANAKYRLLGETKGGPALAVGIANLLGDSSANPYLSLTKTLSAGFRGTIGLDRYGLMAGISKELNPVSVGSRTPGTTFMAEFDHEVFNVGLGIALTPQLRANVALEDLRRPMLGIAYQSRF